MIEFSGEAQASFQRFMQELAGYTVELTIPKPGGRTGESIAVDAVLLGPDWEDDDGFAILYRDFDEEAGGAIGPVRSAVAERLYVY